MNALDRGDVVLLPFPFTDLSTTKQRPAVVLTPRSFNEHNLDVIVAAITSNLAHPQGLDLQLTEEDVATGGLTKPSLVRTAKIVTIDKQLIRKKLGNLTGQTMKQIQEKLHSLI